MTQIRSMTDITYLNVLLKNIVSTTKTIDTIYILDCVLAHNYIINNRSSHLQNPTEKVT